MVILSLFAHIFLKYKENFGERKIKLDPESNSFTGEQHKLP